MKTNYTDSKVAEKNFRDFTNGYAENEPDTECSVWDYYLLESLMLAAVIYTLLGGAI